MAQPPGAPTIEVGQTTWHTQDGGKHYTVLGWPEGDPDYTWRVKTERATGRKFFVNLGNRKLKAWQLPDAVAGAPAAAAPADIRSATPGSQTLSFATPPPQWESLQRQRTDPPQYLFVHSPSKPEAQGLYALAHAESTNGRPVWAQAGSQRICMSSHGRWLVGPREVMQACAGWAMSTEPAAAAQWPHEARSWSVFHEGSWVADKGVHVAAGLPARLRIGGSVWGSPDGAVWRLEGAGDASPAWRTEADAAGRAFYVALGTGQKRWGLPDVTADGGGSHSRSVSGAPMSSAAPGGGAQGRSCSAPPSADPHQGTAAPTDDDAGLVERVRGRLETDELALQRRAAEIHREELSRSPSRGGRSASAARERELHGLLEDRARRLAEREEELRRREAALQAAEGHPPSAHQGGVHSAAAGAALRQAEQELTDRIRRFEEDAKRQRQEMDAAFAERERRLQQRAEDARAAQPASAAAAAAAARRASDPTAAAAGDGGLAQREAQLRERELRAEDQAQELRGREAALNHRAEELRRGEEELRRKREEAERDARLRSSSIARDDGQARAREAGAQRLMAELEAQRARLDSERAQLEARRAQAVAAEERSAAELQVREQRLEEEREAIAHERAEARRAAAAERAALRERESELQGEHLQRERDRERAFAAAREALELELARELQALKEDFHNTMRAGRDGSPLARLRSFAASGRGGPEAAVLRRQLGDMLASRERHTAAEMVEAAEEVDAQRAAAADEVRRARELLELADEREVALREELRALGMRRCDEERLAAEAVRRAEEQHAQAAAKAERTEHLLRRERQLHEELLTKERQLQQQLRADWEHRERELECELAAARGALAAGEEERGARIREGERRRDEMRTLSAEFERAREEARREHEREMRAAMERAHQERAALMEDRRRDAAAAAEALEEARAAGERRAGELRGQLAQAQRQLQEAERTVQDLRQQVEQRHAAADWQAAPAAAPPPDRWNAAPAAAPEGWYGAPAEQRSVSADAAWAQPQQPRAGPPAYRGGPRLQLALQRRGSRGTAPRSPRSHSPEPLSVPDGGASRRCRSVSPPRPRSGPAPSAEAELRRLQQLKEQITWRLQVAQ
eukprot:TRINITY_DN556_c1_g1_i1.p1 TRINITY_DN556_c1_g1~~TRINITY_DN556_c1_g1_i1.p1  ORF type:complete len:1107 (+),score=343.60 TRINITY_DN556_c1_g1_i1:101-3421(+)